MKIISFVNLKGGTGKTSLAFNLVGLMAKKNKKVLVIDADAQANMTNNFGIDDGDDDVLGLAQVFDNKNIFPYEVILKAPIANMPFVDVIPCNIYLSASEMMLISRAGREYVLKSYINKYYDYFKEYDYIIFDTAPNIGAINMNVLYASDEIILVSDVGIHGYKGCRLIKSVWEDLCGDLKIESKINGIIINRFDRRIRLSSEFAELIKETEELNEITFDTFIPENIKVRECEAAGIPLVYYDTKNVAIKAYIGLYKEMIEKGIL